MKKSLFGLAALSALVVSASASAGYPELPNHREMQTFLTCRMERKVMDLGISINLMRERVGTYTEASLTFTNVLGREVTRFSNVRQVRRTPSGKAQTFSGRNGNDSFRLSLSGKTYHNGDAEAVLETRGSVKTDMVCRFQVVLF
jgi:hypothetical protein